MSDPSYSDAIKGLSLIAKGAAMLDRNYGALPLRARDMLDDSILQQIDAISVDRLRATVELLKEGG